MGESTVAASNHGDKMGGAVASSPGLEVSVSFGRFENDSLSWEKWSSFSPNKYLEEVEKCATPGSVAQKKAYFEAHYKKIAARKAEQLDQGKQIEQSSFRSDDQNTGYVMAKTDGTDSDCDKSDRQTSVEGEVEQESKLDNEVGSGHVDQPNGDASIYTENQVLSVERVEGDHSSRSDISDLNMPQEAAIVREEETSAMEYQEVRETPKKLEKKMESISTKKENVKLNKQKQSQKVPSSTVKNTPLVKKKVVAPLTAAPQISTSKVSKPLPTTAVSASRSSTTKNLAGSMLTRSKNSSAAERRKVAPKSLHMSLSLDTQTSDQATPKSKPAALTSTRKSFIMEKMGDKEIVKRAFKTFQNNFNQLKISAEQRSVGAKQMITKGTEVKVSTSMTPRKENGGSLKAACVDKKNAKAAPSSLSIKSDDRVGRSKEFSKNSEGKSNVKDAAGTRLQTKSKEEKDAEIKKLRQSLNFKATPMPGFYQGQKVSKIPLDKEGSKTLRI